MIEHLVTVGMALALGWSLKAHWDRWAKEHGAKHMVYHVKVAGKKVESKQVGSESSTVESDLVSALVNLGMQEKDARVKVKRVMGDHREMGFDELVREVIK